MCGCRPISKRRAHAIGGQVQHAIAEQRLPTILFTALQFQRLEGGSPILLTNSAFARCKRLCSSRHLPKFSLLTNCQLILGHDSALPGVGQNGATHLPKAVSAGLEFPLDCNKKMPLVQNITLGVTCALGCMRKVKCRSILVI